MSNFKGKTMGHRAYLSAQRFIDLIDGDEIPNWDQLTNEEQAAWEGAVAKFFLDNGDDQLDQAIEEMAKGD